MQFQAFVPGTNVRIHTIGGEAFATEVECDVSLCQVTGRCLAMAEVWDSRLPATPDGEVFCFEISPSPAFSYFEANTGQPIARALARYLAEGSRRRCTG